MIESDLLPALDSALRPLGSVPDVGEECRDPPLDILRYNLRDIRLNLLPVVGRALSLVVVVPQPCDVAFTREGYVRLFSRLAMAANGRYPPWRWGLSLGLTALILTTEPIGPEDDATLQAVLDIPSRPRAVLLGLFRLNLDRE